MLFLSSSHSSPPPASSSSWEAEQDLQIPWVRPENPPSFLVCEGLRSQGRGFFFGPNCPILPPRSGVGAASPPLPIRACVSVALRGHDSKSLWEPFVIKLQYKQIISSYSTINRLKAQGWGEAPVESRAISQTLLLQFKSTP